MAVFLELSKEKVLYRAIFGTWSIITLRSISSVSASSALYVDIKVLDLYTQYFALRTNSLLRLSC